eukprot:scaffold12171_cov61-Phaeocystis_antarctica.AAC.7
MAMPPGDEVDVLAVPHGARPRGRIGTAPDLVGVGLLHEEGKAVVDGTVRCNRAQVGSGLHAAHQAVPWYIVVPPLDVDPVLNVAQQLRAAWTTGRHGRQRR